MYRQSLLVVFGLSFSTSCVPLPMSHASSRISQPIADAQPLLRRLDLTVPVDNPSSHTAFARDEADGAPAFLATMRSDADARRATDCLTQAVYYEARSEPVDGQRAVAQVVLNRVRDRAFPHSICGVVYQGSERRTGCQFSFTCDGSMQRPMEPTAWDRARLVAQAALAGSVYAPVGSATHYHANYVLPWWASSLTRIGAVGSHIFYRWRGALERALAFREDYSGSEPGVRVDTGGAIATTPAVAGVAVHYASGAGNTGAGSTTNPAAPVAVAGLATERNVMVHRGESVIAGDLPHPAAPRGVHVHRGEPGDAGGGAASASEETLATS